MKRVDYIIVGFGLAGMAFAHKLEQEGSSFIVFDDAQKGASNVAAGLYNPVILKRYTLPYKGREQFDLALTFFKSLEDQLGVSLLAEMSIRKLLSSVEDQNNWFSASDQPEIDRFLAPEIVPNDNCAVNAPHQFGEVLETGKLAINTLQKVYRTYLDQKGLLREQRFAYKQLHFELGEVIYDGIITKTVVFAEGYGVKHNPYFGKLPLVGNKGEYLIIEAPRLKMDYALKSSVFIIPLGNDQYKVGATFNWTEKDWEPTISAKVALEEKLQRIIRTPYKIIKQEAGMRPTTGDRRALIGVHPKFSNLALLNGLGTRGIMSAPFLATCLYDFLEHNKPLPSEIAIDRFPKKF